MITTLRAAVDELVHDNDTVALEGFTHLIPFAAGHELIRQQKRDLTLLRMTPDVIYDQLIGVGAAKKLILSWGGNAGIGSSHSFRDAVEYKRPQALELEEHTHAGMACAWAVGASQPSSESSAATRVQTSMTTHGLSSSPARTSANDSPP